MCLKQSFSYFKWVLQAILALTVFKTVFLAFQILIPPFSLTVQNFLVIIIICPIKSFKYKFAYNKLIFHWDFPCKRILIISNNRPYSRFTVVYFKK